MGWSSGVTAGSITLVVALTLVATCSSREGSKPTPEPVPSTRAHDARLAAVPADAADAVSAASDTGGATWRDASVTPSGARALTIDRPLRGTHAESAPVFVARGKAARAAIRAALDDLAVAIPRDQPIVIKLNLGGYDRIKKGPDDGLVNRITNPAFAEALVEELRARGASDIALADGASLTAAEFDRLLKASGYAALAARLKVPILNLSHYNHDDERPAPWKLTLPWATHLKDELVLSDDLIRPGRRVFLIDVPKLKVHRFAVMSMSIKNLMGTLMIDDAGRTNEPWERRYRMHRELSPWLKEWKKRKADDRPVYRRALEVFSERLADLYGAITPDLVLLEGFPAIQGDGFGTVLPLGQGDVLIASTNGCYADYVGADYFGLADSDALEAELGVRRPPAITAVARRYYGGEDGLEKIVVRGDVGWRTGERVTAYFKAMAPFELGARPSAP